MKLAWLEHWPDVVALVPRDKGTQVHLRASTFQDARSVETVAVSLARIFAKNLSLVRHQARRVVGHERYLPLALHPALVLVPLRVIAEGTVASKLGYVNLPAYDACLEAERGGLSLISLKNGLRLVSPWPPARIGRVLSDARALQASCYAVLFPNASVRELLLREDWPAGGQKRGE